MNENVSVERLHELLDLKDRQLLAQSEAAKTLDRQLRFGVDWMLHSHVDAELDTLPAPRIEMHLTENKNSYQEVQVTLVLPQRNSTHSRIPLLYSKRSGGLLDVSAFPTEGELSDRAIGNLPSIVNDACFFMEKTGVPAYVVLSEDRRFQVTSLRPLKLTAVAPENGDLSSPTELTQSSFPNGG